MIDVPCTLSIAKGHDKVPFRSLFFLAVAATLVCVSPRCLAEVEVLASGYDPNGALLSGLIESIDRMVVGEESQIFRGDLLIELIAQQSENNIELLMTLVDQETGRSFEETRTVSRASCLAQARAMARQLFKMRAQPTEQEEDQPAAHKKKHEKVPVLEKRAQPSEQEEDHQPAAHIKKHEKVLLVRRGRTFVSPEPYIRSRVLALALAPMSVMILTGSILSLGTVTWAEHGTAHKYLISGSVIGIFGMVMGPSLAYYHLGLIQRASLMMLLRFGIVATSVVFIYLQVLEMADAEGCGERHADDESYTCSSTLAPLVAAMITYAGGVAIGFIDAALAGKAADRANLAAGQTVSPKVSLLPSVFSHRKRTTMGFSLTISF